MKVETWGAACARTVAKAVEREQVRIRAWTREEAHAHMHAQGWVQAQAVAQAEEEAQTQAASARAKAKRVWWWPRAWVNAKAEALAEALALELAVVHKAVGLWMQGMQGQGQQQVQAWLRVCEAYQVEERARAALFEFGLQRGRYLWLCRQRDHWWLIQIITPITRLPPELLQQILLLVIDDVGGSPLELMRVCKLWYSVVSGIWASLKWEQQPQRMPLQGNWKGTKAFGRIRRYGGRPR
jgi:hypothetical protein